MEVQRTILATICIVLIFPAMLQAGTICAPARLANAVIREETAGFSVNLTYPVLCAPRANQTIRDWVEFRLFDFKKLHPDHDLTDFPHKYEMQMAYALWAAAEQQAVSVKIDVSVYSGGAHPNHWPHTWVFDMRADEEITLDELFEDLEQGLRTASTLCRSVLEQSLGMENREGISAGTEPMDRNFTNFILTEEGVAFFFAPYQVAPYAAGEQVVTIPYRDLRHVLSDRVKVLTGLRIP